MKSPRKRQQKPSELLETPTNALDRVLSFLSPIQQKVLKDTARFILARCSRRAGKTYFDAAKLIHTSLTYAGDTSVYFGLTRESAKQAIWSEILKQLNEVGIAHKYSEAKLEIELANGSRIMLIGADMDKIQDRLRGRKFRLCIVDECAFYSKIDKLILSVLLATLSDLQGQLIMTSSPGVLPRGLFYEADEGRLKDSWSRYHWTGADNPHFQQAAPDPRFKTLWEQELDTIVNLQFEGDWEHPTFKREFLGLWSFDNRSLIYPLPDAAKKPLEMPFKRSQYVLGLNLAQPGQQGLVVLKYGDYNREVQVIDAKKYKISNLDELADAIKQNLDRFKNSTLIVYLGDHNPEILESFKVRYQLPISASIYDKTPYNFSIISTDLQANRIIVKVPDCVELVDEWLKIVKDDAGEEISGQITLLSDAFFVTYLRVYNTHLKQVEPEETDEQRIERQLIGEAKTQTEDYIY